MSAILGYLTWILFFYTSKRDSQARRHWTGFDWGDRLLMGFLLGAPLLLFSSFGVALMIGFVYQKVLIEIPDYTQAWFWSWLFIIALLSVWRMACHGPIHDHGTRWWKESSRRLRLILVCVPFYLFLLLFAIALSSPIYGPVSDSVGIVWVNLLVVVPFFLSFSVYFPFSVLMLLAGIPTEWIIRLIFKGESFHIMRFLSSRSLRNLLPVAQRAFLVALVGFSFVLADRSFCLFTTSLSHMELDSHEDFVVVGSTRSYEVLQPTTATYWIRIPRFPVFRNVTISNPSNYSFHFVKEGTYSGVRQITADTRNATYEALITKGRLSAFNIVPNKHEMRPLAVIPLVLNFNDKVANAKISIKVINDTTYRTDALTERKEITIQVVNNENKSATFREIHVSTIQRQKLEVFMYVDSKFSDKWVQNHPYVRLFYFHCDPGKTYTITFVIDYAVE